MQVLFKRNMELQDRIDALIVSAENNELRRLSVASTGKGESQPRTRNEPPSANVLNEENGSARGVKSDEQPSDVSREENGGERSRSLVLRGVPEQRGRPVRMRVQNDFNSACNVLHFLNIEFESVSVYHLGKSSAVRNSFLKIAHPAYFRSKKRLRNVSRLRFFPGKGIFFVVPFQS